MFRKERKLIICQKPIYALAILIFIISTGSLFAANMQHQFFKACHDGDYTSVKRLINSGAVINEYGRYDYFSKTTPLHLAIEKGHLDIVRLLVENKADLTMTVGKNLPTCRMTPLHKAAKVGHLDIVKYLVANGADAKAHDCAGRIPLYFYKNAEIAIFLTELVGLANLSRNELFAVMDKAVWQEDMKLLNYFFDKGVDVNIMSTGKDRHSLLHTAAKRYSKRSTLKYLISIGADVNAKNFEGKIPLELAYGGTKSVLFYATKTPELELIEAIKKKDLNGVKTAVANKAPINFDDGANKMTPLHFAVEAGSIDIIKYLLEKGAQTEARKHYDYTPLHLAAIKGDTSSI